MQDSLGMLHIIMIIMIIIMAVKTRIHGNHKDGRRVGIEHFNM